MNLRLNKLLIVASSFLAVTTASAEDLSVSVSAAGAALADAEVKLWQTTQGAPEQIGSATTDENGMATLDTGASTGFVYVAAEKGKTTLMTALGKDPSGNVAVNELTTVASVFTHAQFLNSGAISGPDVSLTIAPVADSLVVLILCITVLAQYFRNFLSGLAELAGVTAHPQDLASARRAIRGTLENDSGILRDLTLTKTGRSYLAVVYYDPARPVRAEEMDHLTKTLNADIATTLTGAELCLVVTQTDRTAQMQAPA